ncbi:MAG: MarR family transcriptional regulator [Micropruina sp.]|uniref:MarR family winged helix-turn-helix transcriptional regulator n=1 Tax=Micropruina sp. TaxID=2737536 RepID=UPI0039E39A87
MDTPSPADDLLRAAAALSRWASSQGGLGAPSGVLRLLALVEELGPLRIGDLAQADHTSQPAVTRQVGRLRELGWIERTSDDTDARATLVAITPAGHDALSRARRARGQAVGRLLRETGIADHRVRETTQLIDQLLQAARGAAGKE